MPGTQSGIDFSKIIQDGFNRWVNEGLILSLRFTLEVPRTSKNALKQCLRLWRLSTIPLARRLSIVNHEDT